MELTSSPAVHARRKTLWNPNEVDRSIRQALIATRYSPSPMAVYHVGEPIGLVRGDARGHYSDFTPMTLKQWCSVTGYSDLRTAFSQGHGCRAYFRQECPSWSLNDCWADCWPVSGVGKVSTNGGTYPGTANTARQLDNTADGAFKLSVSPGASETAYLVGWELVQTGSNLGRHIILYDRVLTYEGVSISNTLTTFTNTLAAQRYISSGDPGLMVSVTCQAATGATASNITGLTFTDDQGTTGVSQSTGITQAIVAGSLAPSSTSGSELVAPSATSRTAIPWLVLGGTAQGVRKLESMTCSAANTGTLCLVLMRPIATMWLNGSNISSFFDLTKNMLWLPKIFSTACLAMLMYQSTSNGGAFQGELNFAYK